MNTKNRINRNSIMTGALWLSMLLAMIASMHHVAQQFGSLESAGNEGFGWAAAVAIDAGILALAYGLRNRRKANRGRGAVARLWLGVGFLTFISISANLSAALTIKPGAWFQALLFSATLPIIVILLSDVVSADDEKAARKIEQNDDKLNKALEQLNTFKSENERLNKTSEHLNKTNEQLNAELNAARVELNAVQSAAKIVQPPEQQNGWHEQWAVYLTEHPKASQRERADHFGVSVGTVNTRLKKLNTTEQGLN